MKFSIGSVLAAAALTAFVAAPAAAKSGYTGSVGATSTTFIDVVLEGWQSFGGFGRPNNTTVEFTLDPGTAVTGFDYTDLRFFTESGSWLSEFTLSVNNFDGSEYLDWSPSLVDDEGTFDTASGSWGGSTGGPGPFGAGGSFILADGKLVVTVYEGFDDPFGDTGLTRDALVTSGTLRIFLAPIPEPGTYGMMALGLLAVGAAMRKRRQQG